MSVILEIKEHHMITVSVWKLVRSLARKASDWLFLSDLTKSCHTTGSCHSRQHASRSVLTSTLNTWPPIWCTMYYHITGIFHREKFSEGKIFAEPQFSQVNFSQVKFLWQAIARLHQAWSKLASMYQKCLQHLCQVVQCSYGCTRWWDALIVGMDYSHKRKWAVPHKTRHWQHQTKLRKRVDHLSGVFIE